MNLANNLKKIRKEHHLSQEELADKLGVSRQSVSKWESGGAYPEMDKVLQLCKMFHLNIDELLNQDINDVKEMKQSKININQYMDDFLSFITKTIDMFCSMKFKERIKCVFEQFIIIGLIFIFMLIIGSIGQRLFSDIFSFLPNHVYDIIFMIVQDIYIILFLILGFILVLHIFKIRYLDYYVIVKDNLKDEMKDIDKVEYDKKMIFLKKEPEKIIIRDPNHSGYKFISALFRCVLWMIKFFALMVGIGFCFTLVGLAVGLSVSFMFVKMGLMFLGILLIMLSCISINCIILDVIYHFIVNYKMKKRLLFICFMISLITLGLGGGLCVIDFTNFNVKDDLSMKEEKIIPMEDDLVLNYSYTNYFRFEEVESNDVKIVVEHSKYYKTDFSKSDGDNHVLFLHEEYQNLNVMEEIREKIKDLNHKEYVEYHHFRITVYTSRENIEKLKNNYEQWINRY